MEFNWKSIFINDTSASKPEPTTVQEKTSFPTTVPVAHNPTFEAPKSLVDNPFLDEILDVYQKGFAGLNQDGFDFFEMFKSVNAVGSTNSQSYVMAFAMGKTINPNLSKEVLIEKGKFYLLELEKVYKNYNDIGGNKKKALEQKIQGEKSNLQKEISDIESTILKLQTQLAEKKDLLNKTDFVYNVEFSEINSKIEANIAAKNKIVESINLVISGINQYL